jgi:uncharacterized membrane protein
MNAKDIAYIATLVVICIVVSLLKVSLTTILALNGTIIGFAFTYVLPISLHARCIFSKKTTMPAQIELVNIPPMNPQPIQIENNRYLPFNN